MASVNRGCLMSSVAEKKPVKMRKEWNSYKKKPKNITHHQKTKTQPTTLVLKPESLSISDFPTLVLSSSGIRV
jgi:hypothetical protein